jgi:uncharacterized protein YraI
VRVSTVPATFASRALGAAQWRAMRVYSTPDVSARSGVISPLY